MHQNKIKILYVLPYCEKIFGAEEQDLSAGIDVLHYYQNIETVVIKVDLNKKALLGDSSTDLIGLKLSMKDLFKFIFIKFTTLDHAMTQAYTYQNYKIILTIIKEKEIDIVFTNTTSCVLFGIQSYSRHLFRSVGFEPIYTLKTVKNKLQALLHSIFKFLSIHKELMANTILCISPRDLSYYKFTSLKLKSNLIVMPLRQFFYHNSKREKYAIPNKLNIGFLGSTYNVLHNHKSYEFIVRKIPNSFWEKNNVYLNIYGRKITLSIPKVQNIHIHHWVKSIDKIYSRNQIFLAPFYLSSGMQSKVFEPFIRGKILICDPRVLSGYSFKPNVHYIPASSPEDFMTAILWAQSNFRRAAKIAHNGKKQAQKIISKKYILSQTSLVLNNFKL
jgi:hypothetical protein